VQALADPKSKKLRFVHEPLEARKLPSSAESL
jgi:hypothetical protein